MDPPEMLESLVKERLSAAKAQKEQGSTTISKESTLKWVEAGGTLNGEDIVCSI